MSEDRGITGGQNSGPVLVHAAAAVDARGVIAPAAMVLDGGEILDLGSPQQIGPVAGGMVLDAREEVLLPGLVNAHCHLDLSGPGPVPPESSFSEWLDRVLALRGDSTPAAMAKAVEKGIELSLAGGTAFVGDIAGFPRRPQLDALRASNLGGTCFPEFFGLGDRQPATCSEMAAFLRDAGVKDQAVRCGLSPHAPYSCGPEVIRHAVAHEVPVAIHVAESLDEAQFLADGTGAFREKTERLGAWNDGVVIPGSHPVEYVLELLGSHPAALVHLNYIEPHHLPLLADSSATVVYCPRASAYFGHPSTGVHQYREMIEHGIPVALGTDSLLCLDTPDRISVLDEMRLLFQRDAVSSEQLIKMATHWGAQAIGEDPSLVDFSTGSIGGVMALKSDSGTPTLDEVLQSESIPRWIMPPQMFS